MYILSIYFKHSHFYPTIDHRIRKTGLPVRSAVLKPDAGTLVVASVTSSESVLLIVFAFFSVDEWIHGEFLRDGDEKQ